MVILLQDVLSQLPFEVQKIYEGCGPFITPDQALGILESTKLHYGFKYERGMVGGLSAKSVSLPLTNLIQSFALEKLKQFTFEVDVKIAVITKFKKAQFEGPESKIINEWVEGRVLRAFQKLIKTPDAVALVKKAGIDPPKKVKKKRVSIFFDNIRKRLAGDSSEVKSARQLIKAFFFDSVVEGMPPGVFEGIQKLYTIPEARAALQQAGVSLPSFLTKDNVSMFLLALDDRCEGEDAAAVELEIIIKPYLDFLLCQHLLSKEG